MRRLQRMVERDTYGIDVFTPASATTAALRSTALALPSGRIGGCVSEAIGQGGDRAKEKVGEGSRAIVRDVRS
ncbi:metal-sensing transcriptional repressor [Streptomyces brevispora]|uniref:metal-sensing transcriptional repressor n=1 Tax=Streptomyces brevispora TaxID=887462 RepID=UPI003714096D